MSIFNGWGVRYDALLFKENYPVHCSWSFVIPFDSPSSLNAESEDFLSTLTTNERLKKQIRVQRMLTGLFFSSVVVRVTKNERSDLNPQ